MKLVYLDKSHTKGINVELITLLIEDPSCPWTCKKNNWHMIQRRKYINTFRGRQTKKTHLSNGRLLWLKT